MIPPLRETELAAGALHPVPASVGVCRANPAARGTHRCRKLTLQQSPESGLCRRQMGTGCWSSMMRPRAFALPVASSKRGFAPQPVRPRPTGTDGSGSFLATRGFKAG